MDSDFGLGGGGGGLGFRLWGLGFRVYLALDEIYHPIYAPIPRSVTLRASTVHGGHQAKHRILTHVDALFQEAYARAAVGSMSKGHNPRQKPRFPTKADPCSFAITEGILFSSFSSAYLWVWGFGVWGLGFGVWGLGFGVWGLGFGVWGLGFGV